MKTYALKVEPFTEFDEPKAQALKPLEEAAEAFAAWQASGIDGAGPITPEMRGDIVCECLDVIQSCVNLIDSIGTTDAELRDATRRVYANNVERGRYEPYQTGGGFGPFPSKKVVAKLIHVCQNIAKAIEGSLK